MTFGLEHLGICAKDPAAMVEWYEKHLGTKTVRSIPDRNIFFIITANGVIIEIYPAAQSVDPQKNNVSGIRHIAFEVPDIEEAQRKMIEDGVDIDREIPAPGDTRLVHFRDIEGNLLDLVQRTRPLI